MSGRHHHPEACSNLEFVSCWTACEWEPRAKTEGISARHGCLLRWNTIECSYWRRLLCIATSVANDSILSQSMGEIEKRIAMETLLGRAVGRSSVPDIKAAENLALLVREPSLVCCTCALYIFRLPCGAPSVCSCLTTYQILAYKVASIGV